MPLLNTADALYLGNQEVDRVYLGTERVWPPVPVATYADTVLADNPLGYWPLTELSGTTMLDASGNGRNGTIDAGVTLGAPALLAGGTSWALNAAEGSQVAAASWMAPAAGLTAEAWVYLTSYHPTNGNVVMCRSQVAASNSKTVKAWSLQINHVGGVTGRIYTEAGLTGSPTSGPGVVPLNTLCHVVAVQSATQIQYWCNGVVAISAALAGVPVTFASNTQPLTIGRTQGTGVGNYVYNGRIGHAALYGTALSPARILAHYEAGT